MRPWFSKIMSVLGGLCAAVPVAGISGVPGWVGPVCGVVAFIAGKLSSSPVDAKEIASVKAKEAERTYGDAGSP